MWDRHNNPEDSIVASLRQIIRGVDLHSRSLLHTCGLTGPQLALLRALQSRPGASARDLADALRISQPTVTGIVDRLAARELIVRGRATGDRRRAEIHLTDAGRELLARAPSLLQDSFRKRLAALEEWEVLQILASLRRVATLMSADELDAAPMLVPGPIEGEAPGEPVEAAAPRGRAPATDAPAEGLPSAVDGRRWIV